MLPAPALAIIVVATLFAALSGAKDGASSLAAIITSRSMAPLMAVAIVVLAQFVGPFVFGIAVARTVGSGIADQRAITVSVVMAALVGATTWNVLMWWLSIPSSSSHALVGGLVGAVLAGNGFDFSLLQLPGLAKVAIGLFLAPIVGLVAGYVIMSTARFLLRGATPRANIFFKRGQALTTIGLALSFGANDAPKAMGIMTMGLLSVGLLSTFAVPLWVIFVCAGAMALGTLFGGWRMVRTLGTRFYRVRAIHAFNSQLTSTLILAAASLLGAPVSASQVVSSAIAGVGAGERATRVRWGILGEIVLGWLLTIPANAVVAGMAYFLFRHWLGK